MIPAEYYHNLYLFIVTIMTFFAMSLYNKWGKLFNAKGVSQLVAFVYLIIIILFIGTRPVSGKYFVDMINYSGIYEVLMGQSFRFSWETDNLIWDNLFAWMASVYIPFWMWVLLVAAAYFGLMFWACQRLYGRDVLLAFVTYLGAFSTFSYGTNGMKAGVAASLFLVAMAYRDKLWISVPIALLTYGFHHSMAMVIASYFVVLFFKNPKYYFWGWITCLIIATLHITFFQTLFAGFTDEHGAEYLTATEGSGGYIIGFRPDFILYSSVPVYLGYQILNKYKFQSVTYSFLLRLYIMANAMWMLCMYANFSNRIAYLSWFMYPIVLLYPFVSREKNQLQGKYLRRVVYGHLGFTLFMTFVYYGILSH